MTPRQWLETVLDAEHADAIIAHRKAKRCPLTERAAKLLAKEFAKCDNPNDAADEMLIRGWQGFKAEWINKPPAFSDNRRNYGIAGAFTDLLSQMDRAEDDIRRQSGHSGLEQDVSYAAIAYSQREPD